MGTPFRSRLAIVCVLVMPVALSFCARFSQGQAGADNEYFTGNVVPLKNAVKKDKQLALVTAEGKEYPLLKDDASLMFFTDARLLKRPMRLTGRLVGDPKVLQVINVHSMKDGKLFEVFYWCDICTIKSFDNAKCACCGDPVELREVPVK